MKFIVGFILGIILTFALMMFNVPNTSIIDDSGLTMFDTDGDCITKETLKIIQVIEPNMALAHTPGYETVVLLTNHEGNVYYDAQKVKIPSKKCAKQIGTYKYKTTDDFYKTVPVVEIK